MPNDNKAAWRLTDKGWLYIVGDAQRAGAGLLTLLVDDVDEWIADLARRGLAPDAIETIPGAVREAVNVYPDGNRIIVRRPLGAGRRHVSGQQRARRGRGPPRRRHPARAVAGSRGAS